MSIVALSLIELCGLFIMQKLPCAIASQDKFIKLPALWHGILYKMPFPVNWVFTLPETLFAYDFTFFKRNLSEHSLVYGVYYI